MQRYYRALLSLVFLVPAGFYTKIYNGPGHTWVQYHLGGLLYVVFGCLVLMFLLRHAPAWKIALIIFIVNCGLEFMQLWHPPFLEYIRSYQLGKALIGLSFDWTDFPYYVAGSVIGWGWLKLLERKRGQSLPRFHPE
jgi:hypothetical protein